VADDPEHAPTGELLRLLDASAVRSAADMASTVDVSCMTIHSTTAGPILNLR
jgi:hypothetical protein